MVGLNSLELRMDQNCELTALKVNQLLALVCIPAAFINNLLLPDQKQEKPMLPQVGHFIISQNILSSGLLDGVFNNISFHLLIQMKKQVKSFADYSINIRKSKRKQEMQRLMNSIRFSNELEDCIAQQESQQPLPDVTPEYLDQLQAEQNFDLILHILAMGGQETIMMIQNAIGEISNHLFSRLNTPKGALAIRKLCQHSQLFVGYLYQSERMEDIVNQLKKMPIGSKQHHNYLSCIFYILEKRELMQIQQIRKLFSHLEEVFYHEAASGAHHNLSTRIISSLIDCSNYEIHFSQQFVLDYFQSIWKSDNVMNQLNIYLAAIAVVKRRVYNKSTSILINAARVVLRGRGLLHTSMEVNLPSKVSLLLAIFRFYNDHFECMDTLGQIHSEKFKAQVTLHQFFLEYECDIFADFQRNEVYLQFLEQFCRNGPSEQIVKKWDELGLIREMESQLTDSVDICYRTLRVYLTLLSRDVLNDQAGRIMNAYGLKETLVSVMQMFHQPKIVDTCLEVLGFLEYL